MQSWLVVSVLTLLSLQTFSCLSQRTIVGAGMEEHGVVPDVIDVVPAKNVKVYFFLGNCQVQFI